MSERSLLEDLHRPINIHETGCPGTPIYMNSDSMAVTATVLSTLSHMKTNPAETSPNGNQDG